MSAILDVRNSLSIAFMATSDRYATFFFLEIFDKMAVAAILDVADENIIFPKTYVSREYN